MISRSSRRRSGWPRWRGERGAWSPPASTSPAAAPPRAPLPARMTSDHVLVLVMHHIVSDGWSIGVLAQELAAHYAGRPLAELPVQYADYAIWQRGWLRGAELERQLDHWRRELDGVAPLELPADRPRPAQPTLRGARHVLALAGPARRRGRRAQPDRGRDSVHGAAGRVRGAPPPPQRTGSVRDRHAGGGPDAGPRPSRSSASSSTRWPCAPICRETRASASWSPACARPRSAPTPTRTCHSRSSSRSWLRARTSTASRSSRWRSRCRTSRCRRSSSPA